MSSSRCRGCCGKRCERGRRLRPACPAGLPRDIWSKEEGAVMRLYSMPSSGNSYKIRLLLALTGREVELVDCESGSDALAHARAEGILPFGKVPVLVLDDGRRLAES